MSWYRTRLTEEQERHGTEVFSVSDISRVVTGVLDDSRLQDIWIRGEVTNLRLHSSGHIYFSLSEKQDSGVALIHCVMWRSDAKRLTFSPRDGTDVIAFGSIGHYAPQGRYQFYAKDIRHAGEGEKHLLVERWKSELSSEGLFDPARKKTLPQYPERIGVVTSGTGAVLHDITHVVQRRYPLEILVSPTAVQGDQAHREIVQALSRIDGLVDVIIIGRGGGSFEDLFPFNHPDVVRAIAGCTTPVVSAIGHETDVTLADFAADMRAPTPSAAAELAVPDRAGLLQNLAETRKMMGSRLLSRLDRGAREIEDLRGRLTPGRLERRISERREDLASWTDRIRRAFVSKVERERLVIAGIKTAIDGQNPMHLLSRGYCILEKGGQVVKSSSEIDTGDDAMVRLSDGRAELVIGKVYHDKKI
ncbi:MAG TPA: exodeoxyribonuclease VII large subunit [Methanoregulaceae archaeon]|nr:exodeoxyribonuclease VII large subunit [Methanoregulaceae archaeon]